LYNVNRGSFKSLPLVNKSYKIVLNKIVNMTGKGKGDEIAFLVLYVSLCKLMVMLVGIKGIFSFKYFFSFLNKNKKILTLVTPKLDEKTLYFLLRENITLYKKLSSADFKEAVSNYRQNYISLNKLNYIFRYKRGFDFSNVTLHIYQQT